MTQLSIYHDTIFYLFFPSLIVTTITAFKKFPRQYTLDFFDFFFISVPFVLKNFQCLTLFFFLFAPENNFYNFNFFPTFLCHLPFPGTSEHHDLFHRDFSIWLTHFWVIAIRQNAQLKSQLNFSGWIGLTSAWFFVKTHFLKWGFKHTKISWHLC
jgi:hypothetical protein